MSIFVNNCFVRIVELQVEVFWMDAHGLAEPRYRQVASLDHPPKVPFADPRPVRSLLHCEQPGLVRSSRARRVLIGALGLPRGPLHRLPPPRQLTVVPVARWRALLLRDMFACL
jgi:hypothetical protein